MNVKLGNFDRLVLVFCLPDGIEIFIWDGKSGLSKCGVQTSTRGYSIVVTAKRSDNTIEIIKPPGYRIFSRKFYE